MVKSKILFTASIAKHILRFHLPYLEWFQKNGFETHVACNGAEDIPFVDKKWEVPFVRSPFSMGHFLAYKELKQIIDEEAYTMIHCHTPMASVVTRLSARVARRNGTKVIYTAHGFHFFKNAPLINWLTYYPIELALSGLADTIVTINREDYNLISSKGNKSVNYRLIPGIGVAQQMFSPIKLEQKKVLRESFGFKTKDLLLVYAAEFIERKNHMFIIQAINKMRVKIPQVKVLFCGRGRLLNKIITESNKLGLTDNHIFFLGFRNDIDSIYKMSDIGVSSSKQEGLGLNLIEEMMCGLPVVASEDRGHMEVIDDGVNGYIFGQENQAEFIQKITYLLNGNKYSKMSVEAIKKGAKFELSNSLMEMEKIYHELLSLTDV